ncbi:PREDICTED: mucin-17-like [Calidris pugnax]|uniref:mucin-17-like n=1 Tax=Calidris pugnax TaxID=198806 RepID=UPI00071DD497|nr:PREDICTED: mucin-17-like [Calidris pugnax]
MITSISKGTTGATTSPTTLTTSINTNGSTILSSSPTISTPLSRPTSTSSPSTTTITITSPGQNSSSTKPTSSSLPTTTMSTIITTSTLHSTTTTPGFCANGGIWVDGHCECPLGFTGDTCEDISNTIETKAETNGTVQVVLRVTNRDFTEDLQNHSSSAYLEFVKNFTEQMNLVYRNVDGYQGIQVQNVTPGSVVVDHVVIFSLIMTAQAQEKLNNITKDLMAEIRVVTMENCTDDEMCFNSSDITVRDNSLNFNQEGYCRENVPKGLEDYFFPNLTSYGFFCISNCTPDTASTINCNNGRCQLTRSGPQCFCPEPHMYWYQGNRCESRVSKLAVGLGSAVAILAVMVAILAVLLFRARSTQLSYR